MRRKKTKTVYGVGNITYPSKSMLDVHYELAENKCVKSFTLPTIKDKANKGKYGSYKAEINGLIFESVMEARYYAYLLTQKKEKQIKDIECQVKFNLLPKGKNKFTNKVIRETNYIADFVITKPDGSKLVVDVKGKRTEVFRIKEKLFMLKYPDIEFVCMQWDGSTKSWRNLDEIAKDKRASKRNRIK